MRWERRVRHTTTGGATLLLLALIVLCAVAAFLCGGSTGLVVGLGGVVILNGAAYWCGDRVVRAVTRARPLGSGDAPWLRALVIELAGQARMPVPRIAVLDTPIPDALSTGRDPNHATILVTTGLLARLDTRTLRGVLAHELAHIKGRDTLRGAVAMTLVSVAPSPSWSNRSRPWLGAPMPTRWPCCWSRPSRRCCSSAPSRAHASTRPMRGARASATMPPRWPLPCA